MFKREVKLMRTLLRSDWQVPSWSMPFALGKNPIST